jgi:hypothetical protein
MRAGVHAHACAQRRAYCTVVENDPAWAWSCVTQACSERYSEMFGGNFDTGIYPDEWHWREGISLPDAVSADRNQADDRLQRGTSEPKHLLCVLKPEA